MAARGKAGMTVGQVLTLMFGFLLASVLIFVFGMWVGRDLATQRQQRERPVVRNTVATAAPSPPRDQVPLPTKTRVSSVPTSAMRPTRPRESVPTATRRPTSTPTQRRSSPTPRAMTKPTLGERAPSAAAGTEVWTVQATATNQQVEALVVKRGLRDKGFDAFLSQKTVAGVTWYRIQVGRFSDKKKAEATAAKLRRQGMEAAFVDRLR